MNIRPIDFSNRYIIVASIIAKDKFNFCLNLMTNDFSEVSELSGQKSLEMKMIENTDVKKQYSLFILFHFVIIISLVALILNRFTST